MKFWDVRYPFFRTPRKSIRSPNKNNPRTPVLGTPKRTHLVDMGVGSFFTLQGRDLSGNAFANTNQQSLQNRNTNYQPSHNLRGTFYQLKGAKLGRSFCTIGPR
jgi:hypothetical protein